MTPDQIRALRTGLGWTRHDLANRTSLHFKSIALWETQDGSEKNHGPDSAVCKIRAAFAREFSERGLDPRAVDDPAAARALLRDRIPQMDTAAVLRALAEASAQPTAGNR